MWVSSSQILSHYQRVTLVESITRNAARVQPLKHFLSRATSVCIAPFNARPTALGRSPSIRAQTEPSFCQRKRSQWWLVWAPKSALKKAQESYFSLHHPPWGLWVLVFFVLRFLASSVFLLSSLLSQLLSINSSLPTCLYQLSSIQINLYQLISVKPISIHCLYQLTVTTCKY